MNSQTVLELSEEVFQKAKSEPLRERALELIIYGYLLEENFAEVEKRLRQYTALFGANPYLEGYQFYRQGEWEQAIQYFRQALEVERSFRAGECLSEVLVKAGKFEAALQLCSHPVLEKQAVNLFLILQSQAFENNQIEWAAQIGQQGFKQTQDATIAYNTGCAFARQNKLLEAQNWVSLALQNGFDQKALLESDPDMAELRKLPEFEQLYQKIPDETLATPEST